MLRSIAVYDSSFCRVFSVFPFLFPAYTTLKQSYGPSRLASAFTGVINYLVRSLTFRHKDSLCISFLPNSLGLSRSHPFTLLFFRSVTLQHFPINLRKTLLSFFVFTPCRKAMCTFLSTKKKINLFRFLTR